MCEFDILVNDRPIYTYNHNGKRFIEGRHGKSYTIRFRNNSNQRKLIVVSVDGLNVMTGDSTWERGYVVRPYSTIDIPGWRKDKDNTARFEFASLRDSYNQHNDAGNASNVGVIGCKVFNEKYVPPKVVENHIHHHYDNWNYWPEYPIPMRKSLVDRPRGITSNFIGVATASAPLRTTFAQNSQQLSSFTEASADPLGTGWGDNTEFKTVSVDFDPEPNPTATFLIYYDTREGLIRRGVNLSRYTQNTPEPNAFPDGCPSPR